LAQVFSPDLKTGTILETFQPLGTIPDSIMILKRRVKGLAIEIERYFNTIDGISSKPGALVGFNVLKALITSSSVKKSLSDLLIGRSGRVS